MVSYIFHKNDINFFKNNLLIKKKKKKKKTEFLTKSLILRGDFRWIHESIGSKPCLPLLFVYY